MKLKWNSESGGGGGWRVQTKKPYSYTGTGNITYRNSLPSQKTTDRIKSLPEGYMSC